LSSDVVAGSIASLGEGIPRCILQEGGRTVTRIKRIDLVCPGNQSEHFLSGWIHLDVCKLQQVDLYRITCCSIREDSVSRIRGENAAELGLLLNVPETFIVTIE